jgi:hypothetical protein
VGAIPVRLEKDQTTEIALPEVCPHCGGPSRLTDLVIVTEPRPLLSDSITDELQYPEESTHGTQPPDPPKIIGEREPRPPRRGYKGPRAFATVEMPIDRSILEALGILPDEEES